MSNNEAEYEVVLVGIRMAVTLQVRFLKIFSDSKIVVDQINWLMLTKDTRMITYKMLVLETAKNFEKVVFINVRRKENSMVGSLAIEASLWKPV